MKGDFSKKELDIIYELTNNSRTSLNKIAQKINLSQQGLNYKISKLQESGIILDFHTLFDYSCFGYNSFKVFINLNSSNEEEVKSIISYLKSHNFVLSVTLCGGRWDIIVTFASKNISKFNKELKLFLSRFPNSIRTYSILTNIVNYNLGKRYLSDSSLHFNLKVIGGDRELTKIDMIDQKLIKEIFDNPRVTYVSLASKYKLNPKTIINKIKTLETKGIIKGYSCSSDVYQYNHISNKILIKYYNPLPQKEEEIMKFFKQNKKVVQLSKVLGEWDLDIDVDTKDILEFREICSSIRSKFGDSIQHFETIPLFTKAKVSYLPQSFFSEVF